MDLLLLHFVLKSFDRGLCVSAITDHEVLWQTGLDLDAPPAEQIVLGSVLMHMKLL